MATLDDTAAPVAEKSVESSASAVEWASIFGGALAALRGDGHPFDTWSGPRVDHGLSVVLHQSIANNFWHGRRDMAGRHPMAVVSLRRIFGRAPSDQMGWHPHRGGFFSRYRTRPFGLGIGNIIDCPTRHTRLGRDCGSGSDRSLYA